MVKTTTPTTAHTTNYYYFVIFIIIPSVFASSNLGLRTNLFLVITTILLIIFLTFNSMDLPAPLSDHFHVDAYYYYSIPIALIIALVFLNYFAIIFGSESRLRKEALNKMEEVMAQEHEMLSLGGQAAAAAHSLGTPLSTIKIITQELLKQFKNNKEVIQDIELLESQVERCNQILRRLSLNPNQEDDFIDEDLSMKEYLKEREYCLAVSKRSNKNDIMGKILRSRKICRLRINIYK